MIHPIHPMAVLPTAWLSSPWYATLTGFVAVNTLLYVVLSVAKILPRLHPTTWFSGIGISRRRETRSIYPESTRPADLMGGDT